MLTCEGAARQRLARAFVNNLTFIYLKDFINIVPNAVESAYDGVKH